MTSINKILSQKKNNKKGITLIYALLAILLFSVVEIVIFNAATANYARMKSEKANQQAYLTVSSAANAFAESVAGDSVILTKTADSQTGVVEDSWSYKEASNITINTDNVSSALQKFVMFRYNGSAIGTQSTTYTINATFTDKDGTAKKLDTVYVNLKLINYDISASFSNWNGDNANKPENIYYVTVDIPFVKDNSDATPIQDGDPITIIDENDPSHTTIVTKYKVGWDKGNVRIVRGDSDEAK